MFLMLIEKRLEGSTTPTHPPIFFLKENGGFITKLFLLIPTDHLQFLGSVFPS